VTRSWTRFFIQFQIDLKLWFFCVVFLEANRALFLFYFKTRMIETTGTGTIAAALLNGLRFDTMVSTYWIILPLIGSLLCGFFDLSGFANRMRSSVGVLFVVCTSFLCMVGIGYYKEYDDIFNEQLFGIYYDDTRAVLTSIAAEYELIPMLLGAGTAILIGQFLIRRWLRSPLFGEKTCRIALATRPRQIAVTVVCAVFVVFAARGSVSSRPVQRRDAGITTDRLLNNAIINPYMALKYALKDQRRLSSASGLETFWPGGDILAAAQEYSSFTTTTDDLDAFLLKYARGSDGTPPRHVFLVIEESYDAWPLMDRYRSLRLTENLRALAAEGIHVRSFLPASNGTMTSLAAIITGLADAGVHTNYQPAAQLPFPSSVSTIFHRLGYRTRFFYGGYLTWQRIAEFAIAQGFNEVYGAAHIGKWSATNEWGVDDKYLFEFVAATVHDDQPSFNIILTTTYHPPYDIDVWDEGYPVTAVSTDLQPFWDGSVDLKTLGHLWYADRCLREFVQLIDRSFPAPLVVITGDHSARKFINAKPNFFEKSAVPLVLWGPDVLRGLRLPEHVAGSHFDIVPTVIGLIAPEGLAYYAIGRDLFDPNTPVVGIGRGKVIGHDFVAAVGRDTSLHSLPGQDHSDPLPSLEKLKRRHDALHAVSWWRIMHGAGLPSTAIGAKP